MPFARPTHRNHVLIGLLVAALAPRPSSAESIAPARYTRAADLIPDTALAALTLEKAGPRLVEFRKGELYQSLLTSEAYQMLQANPGYNQAKFGVAGFAGSSGIDVWDMFETLLGEDLTIALEPFDGGKPTTWTICITSKPEVAAKLADSLNKLTGLVGADGTPDPNRSREVDGVRGYQINEEAFYAVFDNVIVITTHAEALERTLRLRTQTTGRLSDLAAFRDAKSRTAADTLAWAYLNAEGLRAKLKDKWIPEKLDNGFASMLFGGIVQSVRDSDTAVGDLRLSKDGASVNLFFHSKGPAPETHKAFFVPAKSTETWSDLQLPRALADVTLRRDLFELWTQRDKLVTPKALSELSEFATNMSNLLGQMDFGDDFLAQVGREIRLLSNLQTFDARSAPLPQFPAFGLTVALQDVANFGQRLESATTMAFSFISMQAAQNSNPSMLVDIEMYKGHKLICAKYPDAPEGVNPLPQRYNFSPAAAVVKDHFVVGSTRQFLKDVIDAADRLPPAAPASPRAGSQLRVEAEELAALLKANVEPLIAKRMLEENKSRADAQREMDLGLSLLAKLDDFVINVDRIQDGLAATVRLGLKASAAKP